MSYKKCHIKIFVLNEEMSLSKKKDHKKFIFKSSLQQKRLESKYG